MNQRLAFQASIPPLQCNHITNNIQPIDKHVGSGKIINKFSRRTLLRTLSMLLLPFQLNQDNDNVYKLIIDNCSSYLHHIQIDKNYTILWRGASTSNPPPVTYMHPPSDLLDEATYGKKGVFFFHQLNNAKLLNSIDVTNAHIGTGDKSIAAVWGVPVSIWPVGKFQFCYWRDRNLIYDDDDSLQMAFKQGGQLVQQIQLMDGIENGKEIMFQADGYLEIRQDLLSSIFQRFNQYT